MNALSPVARSLSTNPLKTSAPLGAAMAFLGVEGAVPLFHGSQGCTAFALVLLVRHFKEAIPLQTTAMNEVSTILGGADHVEEALLNLKKRMNPKLVGICSTALTETRGEDFEGDLRLILTRRAEEMAGTEVVFASTPDFNGALEEGWSKATLALVDALVPAKAPTSLRLVNVLPGVHLTVGDIEALRDTIRRFDLEPVFLPDVSQSLDGITTGEWSATTYGGTTLEQIRSMGGACATIAIGEHMRDAAELLAERTGAPAHVLPMLTGLDACDDLVATLTQISGAPAPADIRRERQRLLDAMLDGHFYFAGKKLAVAAEPDLLLAIATLATELGAKITAAVTTVSGSRAIELTPADVVVGDLGDLEDLAADADMIVSHAHGRQAAERLGVPHLRVGFPIFDRLGATYRTSVGYAGTRGLIFEIANLFLSAPHGHAPHTHEKEHTA
ncbi:MAG: nitrogenase iron-molybdenum cofactor biosynthesis protein NifN [Methylobacteriaceae bacterium]|nr:nitrogenase iron-molybdenum cofactor biosynthesis protein NifN [Methylobacteriaceae bacterium]